MSHYESTFQNNKNFDIHRTFLINFKDYEYGNERVEIDYHYNKKYQYLLKNEFNLDQLRKDSELETIIAATDWVHKWIKQKNAEIIDFSNFQTIDILREVNSKNVTGNCKTHAFVLQDILLALGIKNKMIFCKPIDFYFTDCHVVNHVFSSTYNKWLLFDAANNLYYQDESENIMNLPELREAFILNKNFEIEFIDIEDKFKGQIMSERMKRLSINLLNQKIKSYVCKNVFRFSLINQYSDSDTIIEYNLIPFHYLNAEIQIVKKTNNNKVHNVEMFVTNPDHFWQLPL